MSDRSNGDERMSKSQTYHLFKPASWKLKIDFIHQLVRHNQLLTLILTEKGGGKTSFASLLHDSFDERTKVLCLNAGDIADEASLNSEISMHLNTDLSKQLGQSIKIINQNKQHFLLIVDDADQLSDSLLHTLMKIVAARENCYFKICLLADYTIVPSISELQAQESEQFIHSMELGHLKEKECKTYFQHLIKLSAKPTLPLSDETIQKIYKLTGGDLAKINAHFKHFIQSSTTPKNRGKGPGYLRVASELGIAVLAVTLVLSYYFKNMTPNMNSDAQSNILIAQNQAVLPSSIAALPKQPWSEKNPAMALEEMQAFPSYLPAVKLPKSTMQFTSMIQSFDGFSTKTVPDIAQTRADSKAAVKQMKSGYTIQLIAVLDKNNMKPFLDALKAENTNLPLHQDKYNRLHTLTYGQYDSFAEAKAALDQLPPVMKQHKPWIRKSNLLG